MTPRTPEPTSARELRALLARPGIIRSLGAHDVLTALVLERAGLELLFAGGFGVSASAHGLPDLGFLGLAEITEAVRRMAARTSIPIVADADTGYGDLHNVQRTVEELEAAGAAGLILEDQESPKRCGHFEGKSVVSAKEMELKWKAAVRARRNPDFVFVARTDARESHGVDEAIDRANRYCDAGADCAFVEAPRSLEELEQIARRVKAPKLANMLTFGKTPVVSASQLEAMGYKIVVAPIETLLVTAKAVQRLAEAFLRDGHVLGKAQEMLTFAEIKALLGVDEFLAVRDEARPEARDT